MNRARADYWKCVVIQRADPLITVLLILPVRSDLIGPNLPGGLLEGQTLALRLVPLLGWVGPGFGEPSPLPCRVARLGQRD